MSSEDPREKAFECELCGDHFETEDELKDHIWVVHELDGDVPP